MGYSTSCVKREIYINASLYKKGRTQTNIIKNMEKNQQINPQNKRMEIEKLKQKSITNKPRK